MILLGTFLFFILSIKVHISNKSGSLIWTNLKNDLIQANLWFLVSTEASRFVSKYDVSIVI